MDGRRKRIEKDPFSNENVLVWTGPIKFIKSKQLSDMHGSVAGVLSLCTMSVSLRYNVCVIMYNVCVHK